MICLLAASRLKTLPCKRFLVLKGTIYHFNNIGCLRRNIHFM